MSTLAARLIITVSLHGTHPANKDDANAQAFAIAAALIAGEY